MVNTKRNWAGPEARRIIGEMVRDARKGLGLKLREIHGVTGINYSHVHRIETTSRGLPTLEGLDAIAQAVRIDPMMLRAIAISEGLTRGDASRLASYLLDPSDILPLSR